jgi:site-specific recombinase XerD
MATRLEQLKTQFLEHIEIEKGRALKTVQNYDHYISRYLQFSKATDPEHITSASIREFRLWLNRQTMGNNRATGKTVSRKTQNYYMIALRVFLKYLTRQKIPSLSAEEIDLAKVPERHLDLISPSELARLLASSEGSDIQSLRNKAILELLFFMGNNTSN